MGKKKTGPRTCIHGHDKYQRPNGDWVCRECHNNGAKEHYKRTRKVSRVNGTKEVCRYGHTKKETKSGNWICLTCHRERSVENRKTQEYAATKEHRTQKMLEWQRDNPHWQEYQNKWRYTKYHEEDQFRAAHSLRTRIRHALKAYVETGHIRSATGAKKQPEFGLIDYGAIIRHIGECPGEHGVGTGKYTIQHIIPLSKLNLLDSVDWEIAADPENHKWLLWEENYEAGNEWTEEVQELYDRLYAKHNKRK